MRLQSFDNVIERWVFLFILLMPRIPILIQFIIEFIAIVECAPIRLSLSFASCSVVHFLLDKSQLEIWWAIYQIDLVGFEIDVHFNKMNDSVRFFRILFHFGSLHLNNNAVQIVDLSEHCSILLDDLVCPGELVKLLKRTLWLWKACVSRLVELNENISLNIGLANFLLAGLNFFE